MLHQKSNSKYKGKLKERREADRFNRIRTDLVFTIEDKYSGEPHTYDLTKYDRICPGEGIDLARAFAASIWYRSFKPKGSSKNPELKSHSTIAAIIIALKYFMRFIKSELNTKPDLSLKDALTKSSFERYAAWLMHNYPNKPITTKAKYLSSLRKCVEVINHTFLESSIHVGVPKNLFTDVKVTTQHVEPFSEDELNRLLIAIRKDIEEKKHIFVNAYEPKYKGLPEPKLRLVKKPGFHAGTPFHHIDYCTWYFDNVLNCEQLSSYKLQKAGHNPFDYHVRKQFGSVWNFYSKIGAGPDYQAKWEGKPPPEILTTKWKSFEYCWWYFDNKCNSVIMKNKPHARKNGHVTFYGGVANHQPGGLTGFYNKIGAYKHIRVRDIIPYFLLLQIYTGWNMQPVIDLNIEPDKNGNPWCFVANTLDPTNPIGIRSYKNRGKTDPIVFNCKLRKTFLPLQIIQTVIKITDSVRKRVPDNQKKYLWLYDGVSGHGHMSQLSTVNEAIDQFADDYKLKEDKRNKDATSTRLNIRNKRIRVTAGLKEYIKSNGDLLKLQLFFNHSSIDTTTNHYFAMFANHPVVLKEIKKNMNAYYAHFEKNQTALSDDEKILFAKRIGVSVKEVETILTGDWDSMFGTCRNPFNSPYMKKEDKGKMCNRGDRCATCPKVIYFPDDLHKIFSYMNYINEKLEKGLIQLKVYEIKHEPLFNHWKELVVPEFPDEVVNKMMVKAENDPFYVLT